MLQFPVWDKPVQEGKNKKTTHYDIHFVRFLGPKVKEQRRLIKVWNPESCPCRMCKKYVVDIGFIWLNIHFHRNYYQLFSIRIGTIFFLKYWFFKVYLKTLLFFSIWVFCHEHSRFTRQQRKGEAIYLTSFKHFHPLRRHLDISRPITAEWAHICT